MTDRWRILLLDTKRSNVNHYLCLGVQRALQAHPRVESVVSPHLGEALDSARDHACNLFLAFDGEELHRGICARLAAQCGRSVLWVTEDPYEIAFNAENAGIFDLVFTNDSASASRYGSKGRHLPLAGDPALHLIEPLPDADCRYDLFFAGTAWPNRVDLLQRMSRRIAGLRTKLILPHNEHLPSPSRKLSIPKSAYSWRVANSQFVRFANRSRVTLTSHREFSSSPGGQPAAATPGPRLFEVALAGGFQLVDLTLQETGRYLEEGKEFVGFRDPDEAVDRLEYYLAHPDERIAIARSAQSRAMREHTYAHRVDTLLSEVESVPERAAPQFAPSRRRRVLQVTHNIVGVAPYGGVEIYQDLVANALSAGEEFEVLFYVPDSTAISTSVRILDSRCREIDSIKFSDPVTQELLTAPDRERAFAETLAKYSIDLVHFQHLIGHVPSLPFIARALGIPTMISLHDYYALCWQINLLNQDGVFCAPESISETTCDICIGSTLKGLRGSQSGRRGFYGRALERIDLIHCNTEEVASRYRSVYPQLLAHPGVIVRGVPIASGSPPVDSPRDKPIRVALLGNFTPNKGAAFLMRLFFVMRDEPIKFEILGNVDSAIVDEVRALSLPNVKIVGGYAPGEYAALLRGASVALFASKWPETYCLSLSEAWQCGLIPVAPDLGAFSERIQHGVTGFKYEPGALGTLVDILRLLAHDDLLVRDMSTRFRSELYETLEEHCRWLTDVYRGMVSSKGPEPEASALYAERSEPSLADCGVTLTHRAWLMRPASSRMTAEEEQTSLQVPGLQPGPSPYRRAIGYLRRYGIAATVRRAAHELRSRKGRGR